MKTNKPKVTKKVTTPGGGIGQAKNAVNELKSAVLTCLLFENTFYEKGSSIAARIEELVPQVDPKIVAQLVDDTRNKHGLRHVSLFLARQLVTHPKRANIKVADAIDASIQRADELSEFLAMYWKDGRQPLAAQVKKGLAKAFTKFSAYNLAKYNRDNTIKLRDVMFMVNPKPKTQDQADTWKKLVDGTLEAPDTWEVALSSGADKKATWERLIAEKKLGGLATLRNLRNMLDAKVHVNTIKQALKQANYKGILPFQFINAAVSAPQLEEAIELAMLSGLEQETKLPGTTLFVVDVSGSMQSALADKSMSSRVDAACALAILIRERCENAVIVATAGSDGNQKHKSAVVPARRGFALRDAIEQSKKELGGGGIFTAQCMDWIHKNVAEKFDRVVVLSDSADCDRTRSAGTARILAENKSYLMNIAPYKVGIGYGNGWTHIDGWSNRVVDYIFAVEEAQQENLVGSNK